MAQVNSSTGTTSHEDGRSFARTAKDASQQHFPNGKGVHVASEKGNVVLAESHENNSVEHAHHDTNTHQSQTVESQPIAVVIASLNASLPTPIVPLGILYALENSNLSVANPSMQLINAAALLLLTIDPVLESGGYVLTSLPNYENVTINATALGSLFADEVKNSGAIPDSIASEMMVSLTALSHQAGTLLSTVESNILATELGALGNNTIMQQAIISNIGHATDSTTNNNGVVVASNGVSPVTSASDAAISTTTTVNGISSGSAVSNGVTTTGANDNSGGTTSSVNQVNAQLSSVTTTTLTSGGSFVQSPVTVHPTPPPLTLITDTGAILSPGALAFLNSSALQVTGGDPAQIVFLITFAPAHGTISYNSSTLTTGSEFSQADWNTGLVQYQNNGDLAARDIFQFTVSNPATGGLPIDTPQTFTFNIEQPIHMLANSGLELDTGALAFLNSGSLRIAPQINANNVDYSITALPQHGILMVNGINASIGTVFTQTQWNQGLVTYTNTGSDHSISDSFQFTVSDNADFLQPLNTPQSFNFTIDQRPEMTLQTFSPTNGTAVIPNADITATDPNNVADSGQLVYTLTALPTTAVGGSPAFNLFINGVGNELQVGDHFTQADLDLGILNLAAGLGGVLQPGTAYNFQFSVTNEVTGLSVNNQTFNFNETNTAGGTAGDVNSISGTAGNDFLTYVPDTHINGSGGNDTLILNSYTSVADFTQGDVRNIENVDMDSSVVQTIKLDAGALSDLVGGTNTPLLITGNGNDTVGLHTGDFQNLGIGNASNGLSVQIYQSNSSGDEVEIQTGVHVSMFPSLVVATNTGVSVDTNASVALNTAELQVTPNFNASNIDFTITQLPTHGTLSISGVTATVGSIFTENDLQLTHVTYQNTGDSSLADSFQFTVSDSTDLSESITAPQTFDFTIFQPPIMSALSTFSPTTITSNIPASNLTAADPNAQAGATEFVYTVTSTPNTVAGDTFSLYFNGTNNLLQAGDSFTQADINHGLVAISQSSGVTALLTETGYSFQFSVTNGISGLSLNNQTFHFDEISGPAGTAGQTNAINGTSGNDFLTYASNANINGVSGNDTLVLNSYTSSVDFTQGHVSNVDGVQMNAGVSQSASIDLNSLLNLLGPHSTLTITGGANDTVALKPGDFHENLAIVVINNGVAFNQFIANASPSHVVNIQADVHVTT